MSLVVFSGHYGEEQCVGLPVRHPSAPLGRFAAMATTPPPVRLDDLARPSYSPEVTEIRAMGAALAEYLPLDASAILAQAGSELAAINPGSDFDTADVGPDGFREPLDVLLAGFGTEAGLSAFGHVSAHTLLVQLAKNRILLANLLAGHPEILDIPIERPIIIVGQPRTGTTHLHNLLAADPALRSLPYWESLQPVPFPGEAGMVPDPRLERGEFGVGFVNAAMPEFRRMHEMTVDHVHEEIQLLAMDYSTMLFESMVKMPSVRDWYLAHDQTPHYAYMKTVLQAMTFLRGGSRWLLKSPQHLEQLPALRAVFPDATVLVTHRDPVPVTISVCTMLCYTQRMSRDEIDLVGMGSYWSERNLTMLRAYQRDRSVLSPDHALDIRFHEFMADDLGTLERIYALADQPYDDAARLAHRSYLASHQRDRFGKVIYEPEQFGLDLPALRREFADYTTQFGLVEEWSA